MYPVYVTNKSHRNIYVRLKPGELSTSNKNFHNELLEMVSTGEIEGHRTSKIHVFLVRYGFHVISPGKTLSFVTVLRSEYERGHIYVSLYAESTLWIMDNEVDFRNFGCLFVTRDPPNVIPCYSSFTYNYSPVNPEPRWVRANDSHSFPPNAIKISNSPHELFFGRSLNGVPCAVIFRLSNFGPMCHSWMEGSRMCYSEGDILLDTGHQFHRVKRGDPVPPNAVIVGTSDTEGLLFLGRVGGTMPCSISTEDGKIKKFCYPTFNSRFESENGEILVLTNDAILNF